MLIGKTIIGTIGIMSGVAAVQTEFMKSLCQMTQFNAEYLCLPTQTIHYAWANQSFHSFARNFLCKQCYGDWILMLDTDHAFDPDLLARMIKLSDEYNIGVLTAIYQYRGEPYPPVLFTKNEADENEPGKHTKKFDRILDFDRDCQLLQVDSAGAGALLIRKPILHAIWDTNEEPFDIIDKYSEDHSFFIRLAKLDIPVFCATQVEAHHLVLKKLTIQDYNDPDLKIIKARTKEVLANK